MALLPLLLFAGLAGCRSEVEPHPPSDPSIDLSGVWAGTWAGVTVYAGNITGNWEADLIQGDDVLFGAFTMSGDTDCMDGTASGALGSDGVVSGTLFRSPCNDDRWVMTALDLLQRNTAGLWDQPALGSFGTYTGIQIARPGGPRIRFVSPPAAPPGAIVSIVGSEFDLVPGQNAVEFNGIPAEVISARRGVLTVRVPVSAPNGPIYVTTAAGTALSPRRFDVAPTHPAGFVSVTIDLTASARNPGSVAIDSEGRRAYVVGTWNGELAVVNTATNTVITSARADPVDSVPVQGLALSPDLRRVYLAAGAAGVTVYQSALAKVFETLPVPSAGALPRSPQGLVISPDGRTLYVSEERDGGAIRVFDLTTRELIAAVGLGTGATPAGVAVAPDGRRAYLLFTGAGEGVRVFDLAAPPPPSTPPPMLPTGPGPVAAAVTPDGNRLYVTNGLGASVTRWDLASVTSVTIPVGAGPSGIAVSPDGQRVLVANGEGATVSVISTATDEVIETIPVDPEPYAIAVSPDGMRAYVSHRGSQRLLELGGPATLSVVKEGSGLGTVTSTPEGISCGPACVGRFAQGTEVDLAAVANANSRFDGWGGDCDTYGRVTATGSRRCTATFTYVAGEPDCFIATAAFGSPLEPEVQTLRAFRDRRLLGNAPGRAFVRFYYAHSPQVASWLREHESARALVRWSLVPVVLTVRHPRAALLVASLLAAGGAWALRLRRRRAWGPGGAP